MAIPFSGSSAGFNSSIGAGVGSVVACFWVPQESKMSIPEKANTAIDIFFISIWLINDE